METCQVWHLATFRNYDLATQQRMKQASKLCAKGRRWDRSIILLAWRYVISVGASLETLMTGVGLLHLII